MELLKLKEEILNEKLVFASREEEKGFNKCKERVLGLVDKKLKNITNRLEIKNDLDCCCVAIDLEDLVKISEGVLGADVLNPIIKIYKEAISNYEQELNK